MDKYPILKFFKYDHLPHHLQLVSKSFGDLATEMAENPNNKNPAEVAAGLRHLLEAKDCAVRALLE